ncbi:MAG TPA: hypothetical protein VNZ64_24940 [Candidatus Acidoferrum sp.]|nr:hypothetical protein [Candidatus Acidoferrum sp.]
MIANLPPAAHTIGSPSIGARSSAIRVVRFPGISSALVTLSRLVTPLPVNLIGTLGTSWDVATPSRPLTL